MRIELIRETPTKNGAICSRVFVDGSFFGYGLENNFYKFPNGTYDLYGKYSPTFKANKVYIKVPGRENIMFHGGNTIEDVKGCVIVAAKRNGETVQGDLSQKLFDIVDVAGNNGESVGLVVRNDYRKLLLILGIFVGAGLIFYLTKKGRS